MLIKYVIFFLKELKFPKNHQGPMDSLNSSEETSTGYNLRSRGKTPNEALNSRTEMEGKIDERVQKYNGKGEEEETKTEEPSQRDVGFFGLGTDKFSVCVLMILYILQGRKYTVHTLKM